MMLAVVVAPGDEIVPRIVHFVHFWWRWGG